MKRKERKNDSNQPYFQKGKLVKNTILLAKIEQNLKSGQKEHFL